MFLESTDDCSENCKALIDRGLLLTNMYGVASPSQPNYVAPGSGDIFGANSDSFILVDKNISTIVDLLEDKGVSWSDYNEGLPYTGFEGYEFDPGLYERKHNLLARFDSIRLVPERNARVKNLT
jgi:acid phosphatase